MANELFIGICFLYLLIALPFRIIDELYAPIEDDYYSGTEFG